MSKATHRRLQRRVANEVSNVGYEGADEGGVKVDDMFALATMSWAYFP